MANQIYALVGMSALSLASCVSAPPNVSSSQPLINEAEFSSGELLSVPLAEFLSGAKPGDTFLDKNRQIEILYPYTSALGQSCKRVRVIEGANNQQAAVCLVDVQWFSSAKLL